MSTSTNNTSDDCETFYVPNKKFISKYVNVLNDIVDNSLQIPTPITSLPLIKVTCESLQDEKASDFLYNLINKTQIEESTLIYSLIYFERILVYDIVNGHNSLLFLFLSIIISIKINEDLTHKNSFYSELAGITSEYLCKLERLFLELLSFKTYVDQNLFQIYEQKLADAMTEESN